MLWKWHGVVHRVLPRWPEPVFCSGCWIVKLTGASRCATAGRASHARSPPAWWRRVPAAKRRSPNSWSWATLSGAAAPIPSRPAERHATNLCLVAPTVRSVLQTFEALNLTIVLQFVGKLLTAPNIFTNVLEVNHMHLAYDSLPIMKWIICTSYESGSAYDAENLQNPVVWRSGSHSSNGPGVFFKLVFFF